MRTCIVCGCTDNAACDGGCSWTVIKGKDRGICSMCPVPIADVKLPKAQRETRREYRKATTAARRVLMDQLRLAHEAQAVYRTTVTDARNYEISLRRYGGRARRG